MSTTDEGTGNPPAQDAPKPTIDGESFDFPSGTPVSSMTPEQKAEYWRHEAKKKQALLKPYEKLGPLENLTQKLSAADAAAQAALSEQERAVVAARTEGESAGFAKARELYAAGAIEASLVTLTRGNGETLEDASTRVQGALKFADVTKFISENGALDTEAIQTFAKSLGQTDSNGGNQQGDPLAGVLRRQAQIPTGQGGSVRQIEEARYAELKAQPR